MHRMRRDGLIAGFLVWIALGSGRAEAQYTANLQTNIISGVTSNWSGDYLVGSNTFADALLIQNSGVLSNNGYGYLGYAVSGSNNSVLVTGSGSVWTNSGAVFVGYYGSGNSLLISNGGALATTYSGVAAFGSSNTVTVTGTNSLLSTGGITVGYYGPSNTVLISRGGLLTSCDAYVGRYLGGSYNAVRVVDPGSVWSNACSLHLGYDEKGNSLVISNGGRVFDTSATIGSSLYVYYTFNTVLVADPGSVWSNSGALSVIGLGNSVVISNGGSAFDASGYVGSSGNSVLVTGPGSVWANNGSLDIDVGSGLGIYGGGRVVSSGGTVGESATNGSVVVTGTGSVWSNSGDLYVGNSGAANSLVITNGGQVVTDRGHIGQGSSANNNSVRVLAGGFWQSGSVQVGGQGSSDSLIISAGSVFATNLVVGVASALCNNLIQLDSGSLIVTNAAHNATLEVRRGKFILNSGTANADDLILTNGTCSGMTFSGGWLRTGTTTVSDGSVFAVGDGTNSATFYLAGGTHSFAGGLWIHTNADLAGCGVINGNVMLEGTLRADCGGTSIFTGSVTNYGRIEAENGTSLLFYGPLVNYGQIIATNGTVWYGPDFVNNGTLVGNVQNGVNLWTNPSDGRWEDANNWSQGAPTNEERCLITNSVSKTVTIDAGTTGIHPESLTILDLVVSAPTDSTNMLWMNNPGNVMPLQVANGLTVGRGGKLVITNGTLQVNQLLGGSVAIDGELSLTAAAMIVTNGPTSIGQSRSGQLTVSSGTALTRETYLGQSVNSSGLLTVTGGGSTWHGSTNLYIGFSGAGNGLVVDNAGQVIDAVGYLGYSTSSTNNTAVVSGTGSVWSNSGVLYAGNSGAGNSLVISNGGLVLNSVGYLGSAASSSNNTALITGPGSVWRNSSTLYVGNSGAGNSLVISNGGLVLNSVGYLGWAASSSNNIALVTDPGSVWSNGGSLYVGNSGAHNSLVISNGGRVANGSGVTYVAGGAGGNDSVLVSGSGSVWNCSDTLYFGFGGGHNSLVISNGGQVVNGFGDVGESTSSNTVLVAGAGSVWSNRTQLLVGNYGMSNRLVISSGGHVFSSGSTYVGLTSISNSVLVTDPGSVWSNNSLFFGQSGNSLVISNGGVVVSGSGTVNTRTFVLVTGTGSVWSNRNLSVSGSLLASNGGQVVSPVCGFFGSGGTSNSLVVAGGSVFASNLLVSVGCNGAVQLQSGSVIVTNATHDATLEVRQGTFLMTGGQVVADRLVMTNACGLFLRRGGATTLGTLVLDPNLSAVGDGIPNGWKQQYGLDPLDPNLTNKDADADGFSNLQEYLAGTDPTNSSSAFRITAITPVGADIRVYFMSAGGKYYSLRRSDFMGGAWTTIVTNIPGNAGIQWVKDLGGATRTGAYYRIELSQSSIPPPADSDNDGIADSWTQTYFGHPTGQTDDLSCASCDADGDGISNLQEFLGGTDPINSGSYFHIISVARTNSADLFVSWMTGTGKTNALQVTTGDASGGYNTNGFTDIFTVTNTVNTTTNCLDISAATNFPSRYYRVRLVQ